MADAPRQLMEPVSQPQPNFEGEFFRPLDEKHRLTVPSPWRDEEPTAFTLVPEPSGQFLLVMPPAEFARFCAEAAVNPNVNASQRRIFLRHFHANALRGLADKQGRLVLPEETCRLLDLDGEVALVGGLGRFEVWNAEKWRRSKAENTSTYQEVGTLIGL